MYEIRIEGFDTTLYEMIKKHFHQEFVLLISNAETILHSNYGNELYWKARMSMRFAKHLQQKGLFDCSIEGCFVSECFL